MRIAIDFDDVLADTFGALQARFGTAADPTIEDLTLMFPGADLDAALESVEFHLEIPPIPGAAAGVDRLVQRGFETYYLSSRAPELQSPSADWLSRWDFPSLSLRCVGRRAKKQALATDDYDVLIDDQQRYLNVARQNGKRAIAFANPWNADWDGERSADWTELVELL